MTTKDRIKELCKERKISVNKLETDLGFGTGYVSKLDKSTPNTKKIQLIADYFKVSVDYLMNGKEYEDFSDENALLVAKIRKDKELSKALMKYFELSEEKRKHIVDTINVLSNM